MVFDELRNARNGDHFEHILNIFFYYFVKGIRVGFGVGSKA